jgi:small subunit ribosomal protein S6
MRDYEVMTIHRPDLAESDIDSDLSQIETFLTDNGGNVSKRDLWGKRRFAYEIDHLSEGFYTVLSFQAQPQVVENLDRRLTLSDEVLRHKIVRLED